MDPGILEGKFIARHIHLNYTNSKYNLIIQMSIQTIIILIAIIGLVCSTISLLSIVLSHLCVRRKSQLTNSFFPSVLCSSRRPYSSPAHCDSIDLYSSQRKGYGSLLYVHDTNNSEP
jgi:hypothetical protein